MAGKLRRLYGSKLSACAVMIVLAFVCIPGFIECSVAGEAGGSARYPSRPIKLVVAAAAGGSIGIEARVLTPLLEKDLGAPIMIEYVAGAEGLIALNKLPQEKPDGYTLLANNTITSIFLEMTRTNAKFSVKNFAHVGGWNVKYQVLVVHPDAWKTFGDFLNDAKKRNISMAGSAGQTILNAHFLEESLGIKFNLVPFSASGEGLAAVAGKHVDCMLTFESTPKPMIQAGKLRALTVLSLVPDPILPGVPNLKELGHEKVPTLPSRGAIWAPPNTPGHIVSILEKVLGKGVTSPELKKMADNVGIYLDYVPSAGLHKEIIEQYTLLDKYKSIIK
jgi:tripartite-type tricarboxylate transporter receptor subunit TctC